MTQIILVIIGVLLAAVTALMMVFYGGEVYDKYDDEANAGRLVNEGVQIETALKMYYVEKGSLPDGSNAIDELVDKTYLSEAPKGNPNVPSTGNWVVDYSEGHIRSSVGSASNQDALNVCIAARRQLNFPNPENIYRCDATDAPGGVLNGNDPCCIRG